MMTSVGMCVTPSPTGNDMLIKSNYLHHLTQTKRRTHFAVQGLASDGNETRGNTLNAKKFVRQWCAALNGTVGEQDKRNLRRRSGNEIIGYVPPPTSSVGSVVPGKFNKKNFNSGWVLCPSGTIS